MKYVCRSAQGLVAAEHNLMWTSDNLDLCIPETQTYSKRAAKIGIVVLCFGLAAVEGNFLFLGDGSQHLKLLGMDDLDLSAAG